ALGLRQSSVSIWKSTGIPRARQCEIEIRTGGALRADLDAVTKPRPKPQSGAPAHAAPVQATLAPPLRAKADGATPGSLSVDAEASSPPHIEERHAASSNVVPTIAETPEEQAQIDAALAELDPAEREEM